MTSAQEEFDKFALDKSAPAREQWQRCYLLAYKEGAIDGMRYTLNKFES